MKVVFNLTLILFCYTGFLFSQGRGDQIFDESYIHEIHITAESSIIEMFHTYLEGLGNSDFTYSVSNVEIDGIVLDSVGVRVKGGVSAFDSKKPLKLDFNKFVSGQKYDGLKKLNLHQGNMDPSYMREVITYSLMRNAGVKTVRTSYAKVYFNGTYEGVYTLVEQIDDNFIRNRFASSDGALYKKGGFGFDLKYEIENPLPYAEFESAVNQIPTDLLHEHLPEYLDVESFLRFFAIEIFVTAVDGPLTVDINYYIYYEPKSGTYVYIPWDYNLSLYGFADHALFTSSANFIFNRALNNPILRNRYLNIYCELLQYNFEENRLQDLITKYQNLLEVEVPNDPYGHLMSDWNSAVQTIRNVISTRVESLSNEVDAHLSPCPPLVNPINPFDLVINELVASNDADSGITDPNGDAPDWIELYNNTSAEINLDGFYLSNDRDVLKHWRFPQGTKIAANDYLIIWADRDVNEEELHSDFKLNKTRGELILSYENGEIVDEVTFSDQETNIGFARVPNGIGDFERQTATFNASNDGTSTSVDDSNKFKYTIYPNLLKSGNAINIHCAHSDFVNLQIQRLDGQLIFKKEIHLFSGTNVLFPSAVLNPGVYILKVIGTDSNKCKSQKIIVY